MCKINVSISGGAGRGFGRGVLRAGFTVNGNDDVSNSMADMSLNKPGGMANGFGKSDNNSSSGGFGSKGGFGGGSSGGGFGGGSGGLQCRIIIFYIFFLKCFHSACKMYCCL